MKNKIPCEIIRDLFPSYIDKLTSDKTNEEIKEHVSECGECLDVLRTMSEEYDMPSETANLQEIDFLRKTRSRNKKIVLGTVFGSLAAIVIVFLALCSRVYFVGTTISGDFVDYEYEISENAITLSGKIADSESVVKEVDFIQDHDVLKIKFVTITRSFWNNNDTFEAEYKLNDDIKKITVDDRIIWLEGTKISGMTSDLFAAAHPYIGDMSQNSKSAGALNISGLGSYINELQTSKEPYGWKMTFENSYSENRSNFMKEKLTSYAYALLATVGNLDEVSFEYMIDKEVKSFTVTTADADKFAGESIKEVGKDIVKLQKLMEKVGLDEDSYLTHKYQNPLYDRQRDYIPVYLTNETDDIKDITFMCYMDGNLLFTQTAYNDDVSGFVGKYPQLDYRLIPADFGVVQWENAADIVIKLSGFDASGKEYIIEYNSEITVNPGSVLYLTLSGDAKSGYKILVGTAIRII